MFLLPIVCIVFISLTYNQDKFRRWIYGAQSYLVVMSGAALSTLEYSLSNYHNFCLFILFIVKRHLFARIILWNSWLAWVCFFHGLPHYVLWCLLRSASLRVCVSVVVTVSFRDIPGLLCIELYQAVERKFNHRIMTKHNGAPLGRRISNDIAKFVIPYES
jgi:hypothetical protein